jgi:hypothetical protein
MWNASRWAVFSPMPGSFASSFTSRAMGSATAMSQPMTRDLDAARRLGQVLVGRGARLLDARVHCGGDEVLEHRLVRRIHRLRIDDEAGSPRTCRSW